MFASIYLYFHWFYIYLFIYIFIYQFYLSILIQILFIYLYILSESSIFENKKSSLNYHILQRFNKCQKINKKK